MLGPKGLEDGGRSGLGGIKEGAARAVLRDAWQRGHHSVELRRDGRRVIFFCTLCSTRCYSDAALSDHLNGNLHSRQAALVAAADASVSDTCFLPFLGSSSSVLPDASGSKENEDSNLSLEKEKQQLLAVSTPVRYSPGQLPPSSLEWLGYGQLLLSEASSGRLPQVKAAWCRWLGRDSLENSSNLAEGSTYAVVIFPYSDVIGRSGDWKPVFRTGNNVLQSGEKSFQPEDWKTKTKTLQLPRWKRLHLSCKDSGATANEKQTRKIVGDAKLVEFNGDSIQKVGENAKLSLAKNVSNRALRRALKKQRVKALERLCFICHQQMLPGKDVAAVLNLKTRQMMCSSRNRRGAFHVFHTSCLIDWILLCEVKFWIAPSVCCKVEGRKKQNQISVKQHNAGVIIAGSNGPIFCPECQGTGVKVSGTELEHPRYRLSQVFEWILELIEARKAWADCPDQWQKGTTGLLFCSDKEHESTVVPMGYVHFYASGSLEFLSATALVKKPTFEETKCLE